MEFLRTKELSKTWKKEILELWNNEYPEKLNYNSILEFEAYIENLPDQSHIVILNDSKNISGWYFDFIREGEKWFAIILDSKIHGQGLGTKLLNFAKEKETELNGWVIDHNNDKKQNGAVYKSPLGFYISNGFEIIADKGLENEKLTAVKIRWNKHISI